MKLISGCGGSRVRGLACVLWSTFFLLVFTHEARADRITPSERVETRLRIRASADGQSTVIGHLAPGESLPLRASIPNWFELAMPNGESGFVSKGYATQIPDTGIAAIPAAELRVGHWNIKKLGHGNNKDFVLVAQIIESNYDVVAIVEVMQKGGGHPGYDALLAQLGSGWAGVITIDPRPDTSSGSAEFSAILFRPVRARLCDGWTGLVYHADNHGGTGGTGPDKFSREPAFACFATTRSDGSNGFDFILAGYHAIFAEGDIDDIKNEVQHLGDVFASMTAKRPGELDLIVAGDFNLVSSDLATTISQQVRTIGSGSTLNGTGALTTNLYDHLVVFDLVATKEAIAPDAVLDLRSLARDNKTFFDTVSDHLPLVGRFRVEADDD